MFNIGEMVLYGSSGVCEIIEITKKDVGGNIIEYYILKPIYSQASTLFIPTHNDYLVSKMRKILSSDEINSIIKTQTMDLQWNDNKSERIEEYREIISKGDCKKLVDLIRQLNAHSKLQMSKGRRLHISDERFLKEAEKMVCDEFSIVLNIDRSEVIPLVLSC